MPWRVLLLRLALGLYAVGLGHSVYSVLKKKQSFFKPALAAMITGFLCHVGSILIRGIEIQYLPITQLTDGFSFFAAVAGLAFLAAYFRYGIASLAVFAFPAIFVTTFVANMLDMGSRNIAPELLDSNWAYIHIPMVILGYAALFLTFAAAVMYLIQERELKAKHFGMLNRLPSLDICDDLAYRSLAVGFPLMTLGLLSGALLAQKVWGNEKWMSDAKTLLSFLTWFIYLSLIHYRFIAGWRGKRAAYLAIAGFVGVLITFVGANLFGGLHTFY